MPIPVIDLFAGPGGLGEGFSALRRDERPVFKIKLSIEKDEHAHQTLLLRAFFRQFALSRVPDAYYHYLRGELARTDLVTRFPLEFRAAEIEAWRAELGSKDTSHSVVFNRVQHALGGVKDWVLLGGPPCQAYSLVGRSRRSKESIVEFEKDQKHRLYEEYLRILADHRPPVFVMENVKGLLSSKMRGDAIFNRILTDLGQPSRAIYGKGWFSNRGLPPVRYCLYSLVARAPGEQELEPSEYVVCAENYGIPQARHRVILIGVRSDVHRRPAVLQKTPKVLIERVLDDLPALRSGISKGQDNARNWIVTLRKLRALLSSHAAVGNDEFDNLLLLTMRNLKALERGSRFVNGKAAPNYAYDWFCDKRLGGFCNHSSRAHIKEDLHRYLFAAVYAKLNKHSPTLKHFPTFLLPDHRNVDDALKQTKFNDRFRVQVSGRPSTTVVSHIAKDGHYYIHYDPTQCRSLTVREAARLQTFPDNYFFEGPRTEQYKQVGNAVPPFLAQQIADIVADLLN